jgi:hypothetical protein
MGGISYRPDCARCAAQRQAEPDAMPEPPVRARVAAATRYGSHPPRERDADWRARSRRRHKAARALAREAKISVREALARGCEIVKWTAPLPERRGNAHGND